MKSVTTLGKACFITLLFLIVSCTQKQEQDLEPENAQTFEVTFRYKVTNTTDSVVFGEKASFALPVADSARHGVLAIDTNVKGKIVELDGGNREFLIEFERLLPREVKIVSVSVRYASKDAEVYDPTHLASSYLAETRLMPFRQPEFSRLVTDLKRDNPQAVIDESYQWVVSNILYSGYNPSTLGAAYALKHRKGDCTEFTYLLAALLRGNGIPARLASGYVIQGSGVLSAADFHSWVEVGINGVWRVLDAQKRHFGPDDNAYFTVSYLDGEASERRFSSTSNISVVMY
ncbi:transglutaminase-like domain-containing protein [Shewanella khirikhana]|uniref:Transglutaminase-like superfamily protein n=1 Tax=Shewanella khirikhana TaxID=1965282 RepID=A0ABN5U041_9GAMM|nr:transglutaminase-like domain-containing protein [Shewanella khirikhana]AZQ13039.1 Transglutaminase-like superfamily protein [Shewanella khirikhana]